MTQRLKKSVYTAAAVSSLMVSAVVFADELGYTPTLNKYLLPSNINEYSISKNINLKSNFESKNLEKLLK